MLALPFLHLPCFVLAVSKISTSKRIHLYFVLSNQIPIDPRFWCYPSFTPCALNPNVCQTDRSIASLQLSCAILCYLITIRNSDTAFYSGLVTGFDETRFLSCVTQISQKRELHILPIKRELYSVLHWWPCEFGRPKFLHLKFDFSSSRKPFSSSELPFIPYISFHVTLIFLISTAMITYLLWYWWRVVEWQ